MNNIQIKIRRKICDSKTGNGKWSEQKSNLIFDVGLEGLASASSGGINFPAIFTWCKIGSSNSANEIAGGTTTFTQVSTTITSSINFFTTAMVGGIFKYGNAGTSNGAEQYITAVTGTPIGGLYPSCTVSGSGMTVAASAGAVWLVQQTGLSAYLYQSNSYITSPGSNGFSFSSNQITLFRTFQFAAQASTYNVSEIGYNSGGFNNSSTLGRIVLGTPDTINPSQFYVVEITMIITVTPGSQTAVTNVGTGINLAGTAMYNYWDCNVIASDGSSGFYQPGSIQRGAMDSSTAAFNLWTIVPALETTIQAANATNPTGYQAGSPPDFDSSAMSINSSGFATATASQTQTFNFTTSGETCPAVSIGACFIILLTTPFTLPTGVYSGSITFQRQTTRTLIN